MDGVRKKLAAGLPKETESVLAESTTEHQEEPGSGESV